MTTPPVRRASTYTDLELFSLTHAEIDEAYRLEREATACEHDWEYKLDGDGDAVADCRRCGERRYAETPTEGA